MLQVGKRGVVGKTGEVGKGEKGSRWLVVGSGDGDMPYLCPTPLYIQDQALEQSKLGNQPCRLQELALMLIGKVLILVPESW